MERAELEAHLRVLELEDALKAEKENGAASRELKAELREARRVYRTLREGGEPGAGVARPATIDTSAGVH